MKNQVEELYKRGLKYFDQKNYNKAEFNFKNVLDLDEIDSDITFPA